MKNKTQPQLNVGDSAVVKSGVKDPDFNNALEAWQGRVLSIEDGIVLIEWDSLTLRTMPGEMIEQCEDEGLDWSQMGLELEEVERVQPRDSQRDVKRVYRDIAAQYGWASLDAEGKRISKVLAGVDKDDILGALRKWAQYFQQTLQFPFAAVVAEPQSRGPFHAGDKFQVTGITLVEDDLHGLIVSVKRGREKLAFPLCDLEVIDKASKNYQPVRDYVVWFANR